jgi:hypothetical protein
VALVKHECEFPARMIECNHSVGRGFPPSAPKSNGK